MDHMNSAIGFDERDVLARITALENDRKRQNGTMDRVERNVTHILEMLCEIKGDVIDAVNESIDRHNQYLKGAIEDEVTRQMSLHKASTFKWAAGFLVVALINAIAYWLSRC